MRATSVHHARCLGAFRDSFHGCFGATDRQGLGPRNILFRTTSSARPKMGTVLRLSRIAKRTRQLRKTENSVACLGRSREVTFQPGALGWQLSASALDGVDRQWSKAALGGSRVMTWPDSLF